jgi:hypothetical protein
MARPQIAAGVLGAITVGVSPNGRYRAALPSATTAESCIVCPRLLTLMRTRAHTFGGRQRCSVPAEPALSRPRTLSPRWSNSELGAVPDPQTSPVPLCLRRAP